jgi:hypothetical protein
MIDVLSQILPPRDRQPSPPMHALVSGDAMERWSLCAEFVSPDVEWFCACLIVSGQQNYGHADASRDRSDVRRPRHLCAVARRRRWTRVFASPHSPITETKHYKIAKSSNTPKELRC